ncbi:MAG: TIGR00282 family metallophosphoesterase [Clostridia bacterium]|nr:TIGR00282 family metallophosphoesterase [Clostridia bacterium]
MNILAIGDIFGLCGVEHTEAVLKGIIQDENIDFCIANGENASGVGMTQRDYDRLTDAGVDVFTMGNHTFGKQDIFKLFEQENNILRPANYPDDVPGCGSVVMSAGNTKIGIINIMGRVNIDISLDCPFKACDTEIKKIKDKCDIIIVDFHAEATSEKRAMLFYLDGRVSALFGTHTHVQTGDDQVTGRGTGYITDLGMTGSVDSVLGVDKDIIIKRFITGLPQRFEYSGGRAALCGAVFNIDEKSGKCLGVKRIDVR